MDKCRCSCCGEQMCVGWKSRQPWGAVDPGPAYMRSESWGRPGGWARLQLSRESSEASRQGRAWERKGLVWRMAESHNQDGGGEKVSGSFSLSDGQSLQGSGQEEP